MLEQPSQRCVPLTSICGLGKLRSQWQQTRLVITGLFPWWLWPCDLGHCASLWARRAAGVQLGLLEKTENVMFLHAPTVVANSQPRKIEEGDHCSRSSRDRRRGVHTEENGRTEELFGTWSQQDLVMLWIWRSEGGTGFKVGPGSLDLYNWINSDAICWDMETWKRQVIRGNSLALFSMLNSGCLWDIWREMSGKQLDIWIYDGSEDGDIKAWVRSLVMWFWKGLRK